MAGGGTITAAVDVPGGPICDHRRRDSPVYCSGRGRHYVGNDVVDELISSETAEPLLFWCTLCI